MVKKRSSRKRSFPLRRVSIQASTAIGALATLDVLTAAISAAGADSYRLMSVNSSFSVADLASATDDSFEFGYAHSDYSAAEVEECLESQSSMDLGDKVAQEQANRLVRKVGIISSSGGVASAGLSFNDGKPVKTRLNWFMSIGDTLNLWVRNGSAANYTTGSLLVSSGDLWIKMPA